MLTEFGTYRGLNCKKNHTFWEAATLMESNCSQEETWLVGFDELRFRVTVSFCFLLWYFLVFHFLSFFLLTCVNMSNASWTEERRKKLCWCFSCVKHWILGTPVCFASAVCCLSSSLCHSSVLCSSGNQQCPPSGPKTLRWLKFLSTGTMSSPPAVVHSLHFPQLKWCA